MPQKTVCGVSAFKRNTMRSTAREAVFKYLYAKAFNKDLPADFIKGLLKDGVTDDDGTDGIPDFLFQRIEGAAAEGEHDGIKAFPDADTRQSLYRFKLLSQVKYVSTPDLSTIL